MGILIQPEDYALVKAQLKAVRKQLAAFKPTDGTDSIQQRHMALQIHQSRKDIAAMTQHAVSISQGKINPTPNHTTPGTLESEVSSLNNEVYYLRNLISDIHAEHVGSLCKLQ